MKKNVGMPDAIVRIIAAVLILYFLDSWTTGMQLVLGAVAAMLVITAIGRVCLLYIPFKFSTAKKN